MAYSLIWLPDVLERAGLKVATVDGWESRGIGDMREVHGVICHHTAGPRSGNMPSLRLVEKGRRDLEGPLAQLGLGRDGTYYVIAAGRAQHAGKGEWLGIKNGNSHFIGIEAENTGGGDDFPWPDVQMDAYRRGVAAILKRIGHGADRCCGHKEWALPRGRKTDPRFDMTEFRAAVADILSGKAPRPALIPVRSADGLPTLRRVVDFGKGDKFVKYLQDLLKQQDLLEAEPDGKFGAKTEHAVRKFQERNGLVPDGIVGPKTWKALV